MANATQRYALVTGANKGIGFQICKQLASKGIFVILAARDEKRGIEAQQKLKEFNNVVFHQLDVVDPASVAVVYEFIKWRFGRLDILVPKNNQMKKKNCDFMQINNAGIGGVDDVDGDASAFEEYVNDDIKIVLADGKLQTNEWAKGVFSSKDSLTEERVDEVVQQFLSNFKEGKLQENQWPSHFAAYKVSKEALNAYTWLAAKKYPRFCINSVCPGFTRTDVTFNHGPLSEDKAAEAPVKLALLPDGGPSGSFFHRGEALSL